MDFGKSVTFLEIICKIVWDCTYRSHSSTLAWKILWTEEPGRLQSMGRWRSDRTKWLHFHFSLSCIGEGNGNPLQWVLAWRIPGMGEPGGLPSMGLHRVEHDWSDLAAVAAAATGHLLNWESVPFPLFQAGHLCTLQSLIQKLLFQKDVFDSFPQVLVTFIFSIPL